MKKFKAGPMRGFFAGKRPFNKSEKAFLRDIKRAKKLVDDNFSGGDSDLLCDTMMEASRALDKIIKGLKPGEPRCTCHTQTSVKKLTTVSPRVSF